jgi:sigma-B regulation protein RsbU (phosphoserine phosphatase)
VAFDAEHFEFTGDAYRLACLELRGGNQTALFEAQLPGLNAWVACRPLPPAGSGGDLYYLSVCSRGSVSRVTLADVAGHGERVSALAQRLRDALHEHADHWDQSALIRKLNDSLLRISGAGRFATAVLVSHYAQTGELLFTNAGHLPPLWYHASAREWTFLQESTPYAREIADLPLGLIAGTAYTQTAVQLEADDLLLLYTDGISEVRDDRGEQLGLDRLLQVALRLPVESASVAGEALLEAVARFRGSGQAADDETVIVLHHHPSASKLSYSV